MQNNAINDILFKMNSICSENTIAVAAFIGATSLLLCVATSGVYIEQFLRVTPIYKPELINAFLEIAKWSGVVGVSILGIAAISQMAVKPTCKSLSKVTGWTSFAVGGVSLLIFLAALSILVQHNTLVNPIYKPEIANSLGSMILWSGLITTASLVCVIASVGFLIEPD